jgi:hypothetical protein
VVELAREAGWEFGGFFEQLLTLRTSAGPGSSSRLAVEVTSSE